MNRYAVSEAQIEKLANYIAQRPWVESNSYMTLITEIVQNQRISEDGDVPVLKPAEHAK